MFITEEVAQVASSPVFETSLLDGFVFPPHLLSVMVHLSHTARVHLSHTLVVHLLHTVVVHLLHTILLYIHKDCPLFNSLNTSCLVHHPVLYFVHTGSSCLWKIFTAGSCYLSGHSAAVCVVSNGYFECKPVEGRQFGDYVSCSSSWGPSTYCLSKGGFTLPPCPLDQSERGPVGRDFSDIVH